MLINKTAYGKVFICDRCDKIHLEFLNILINFNKKEYDIFLNFISNLDIDELEKRNAQNQFNRKIFISFKDSKMSMALYKHEFEQLKDLLFTRNDMIQNVENKIVNNFELTYFNN